MKYFYQAGSYIISNTSYYINSNNSYYIHSNNSYYINSNDSYSINSNNSYSISAERAVPVSVTKTLLRMIDNCTWTQISFKHAKSGAGTQTLLQDCVAKACVSYSFISQTPFMTSAPDRDSHDRANQWYILAAANVMVWTAPPPRGVRAERREHRRRSALSMNTYISLSLSIYIYIYTYIYIEREI